jgi:hypothetical protein
MILNTRECSLCYVSKRQVHKRDKRTDINNNNNNNKLV